MQPISYARHQFPAAIIQHAVWLYLRFTLSYRDVEDLLAKRGLDVFYETVRRWVGKFGPTIARNLRQVRCKPSSRWHLDEMVVRINGRRMYLWRAVDDEGEVLEVLIQRRRNKAAAGKLIRKLLRKQGFAPTCVTTDKLRSYGAAFQEIGLSDRLFASLSGGQAVAPAGVGKPNSDLSAFKRPVAGVFFFGKMAW